MAAKIDRRKFILASGAAAGLVGLEKTTPVQAKLTPLQVVGLRTDYIDHPLGLENPHPALSWQLESVERNARQTAYRILIASNEAVLMARNGDLWDSGRITSSQSVGISYQGRELTSRQRCFWCVQVWDEKDQSSGWSEVSGWEMGLLAPSDWKAQWLAAEDAVMRDDRLAGLHGVWGATAQDKLPRKFRLTIELPAPSQSGMLLVGGGTDRVNGVWLDGHSFPIEAAPKHSFGLQPLSKIALAPLTQGRHVLAVEVQAIGDLSGSSASAMTAFARFDLANGLNLRFTSGPQWRTSIAQDSNWFAPDYNDDGWDNAHASLIKQPTQPWPPAPAMHLRKEFTVSGKITCARLYATALGAYEARLNGQRVGDALLTPESTQYSKRVLYRTYDVTNLLRRGANVLGLTVGDGWYGSSVVGLGRYAWGPPPCRALAQLELQLADGSRRVVATGPQWQVSRSPIVRSEIYDGEMYDARLAQVGWDTSAFKAHEWQSAQLAERPSCRLTAQVSAPIRATQVLTPRAITQPMPGQYVFDFGQNFAGWCRLRVKGQQGTRVEMRFGETLLPSGELDRSNLRAASQTDVYALRGDPTEEIFEPHFTYHGFRYVQISGMPTPPSERSIEGIVLHSDLQHSGRLSIDHPLLQQIWQNTLWTQRSNFMGIPTDCPQRDERLAFMGDAGIFWDAAAFNMDLAAFTRRQMDNVADSQAPNGAYPTTAPAWPEAVHRPPAPGWADGALILAWTAWRRYGDTAIIEQHWEEMNRYLQLILQNNPNHLWRNERRDIGDWIAVDARYMADPTTPHDLIGTAYWANSVALMAEMAAAIGRQDEAESLRSLHERIRAAFARAFVGADGVVGNGSQTSYVLALQFGLIADDIKPRAAERLVADIIRRGRALSTGILGTQFLLDVLADTGHANIAYDLLLRTAYPSWGYMIAQGGTTMWETWDGQIWASDKEKMPNSYNHYMLGSICGFLFRRVLGIDEAAPGFKIARIRPLIDTRVPRCGGHYDSILGRIAVEWENKADAGLALKVTLPANITAQLHVPAHSDQSIYEGSRDVLHHPHVRVLRRLENESILEVGSGSYDFFVPRSS